MSRIVRLALIGAAVLLAGCTGRGKSPEPPAPPDEAELKRLVSEAAGMDAGEFERVIRDLPGPAVADLADQNLTHVLLATDINDLGVGEQAEREFRWTYGPGLANFRKVVDAVRPPDADGRRADLVSLVRPEYISAVTTESAGETISGAVTFTAPGVCEGTVRFVARHGPRGWQVAELSLPANGIRTVRGDDGLWRLAAADEAMGQGGPRDAE